MVRAKRRSGIDPLAYMGDEPDTPFQGTVQLRSPNENDYANWNIGTFWINQNFSDPLNNEIWVLVSKINNVATWVMVGTGGSTGIDFPTDAGTATPAGGLLNILGGTGITTSGVGNTVTVDASGTVADNFPTDAGTAIPAAGILNILGGVGVTTSGAGDTVTINTTSSVLTTGTFTPVLTFGGASVGITYVQQEGMFTKIGIQCFISLTIELSSKGSSTGACSVTGLPFAVTLALANAVDVLAVALRSITYPGGRTEIHGSVQQVTDKINFKSTGSGLLNADVDDTNFSNDSFFKLVGIYFTT